MEGKGFDRLKEEYVRACRGMESHSISRSAEGPPF
jgi:hypothetical protein